MHNEQAVTKPRRGTGGREEWECAGRIVSEREGRLKRGRKREKKHREGRGNLNIKVNIKIRKIV